MSKENDPPTDHIYAFIGSKSERKFELGETKDSVSLDPIIIGNIDSDGTSHCGERLYEVTNS